MFGPFGKNVEQDEIEVGDIAQLSFDGKVFSHNLMIVNIGDVNDLSQVKIAAHTDDSIDREISSYMYKKVRFIHVNGVRQ